MLQLDWYALIIRPTAIAVIFMLAMWEPKLPKFPWKHDRKDGTKNA